jgi:hypothetical protein
MRSDLNAPSSCEWDCSTLPALSVASSPIVTRVRSGRKQPSSKTLLPSRTPSSLDRRFLKGVPEYIRSRASGITSFQ